MNYRQLSPLLMILTFSLGIAWPSGSRKEPMSEKKQVAVKYSKTCEQYWFDSPEDDPRCYALQERLSEAALAGDIPRIKDAINDGANVNGGYYQSFPVLEQAAMEGRTEAVRYLIDMGADTNRVMAFGKTALNSAVYYDRKDTAKALLEKGADVCSCSTTDPTNPTDPPTLNYAIKTGDQEMVGLLVKAGVLNS